MVELLPPRAGSRRRAVVAALALLALLAAGCDGTEGTQPSSPTPSTTLPPPTATSTTAPEPTGSTGSPSTEPLLPDRPDLDAVAVELTTLTEALDEPVAFATRLGDDTLYVAEQGGLVRALDGEGLDPEPVLDLSDEVSDGSEQGLLGIAFSPDGTALYVDFTDRRGDTHVTEFAFAGSALEAPTRREVLFVEQPYANHNGGDLAFGPDGFLYVALGDGGSGGDPAGNGQDPNTLLGTILRIDPLGGDPYAVPGDNPFVDGGGRPEVWHYGLRNPWRFSFDRATGDLWIGDVGQSAWEEIDMAPAGEGGVNWGWNAREGLHAFAGERPPGARDPIHEYPNPDAGVAVTGGFVYRGSAIPALRGAYVFADYGVGDLVAIDAHDSVAVSVRGLGVNGGSVSSFGEDADGELYVLDRGGRLLRLDPAGAPAP